MNAYFFRPLPFEEPDELVLLYEVNAEFGWTDATAAPANALDWRERVDAFEDVALYRDFGVSDITLQADGDPVLVGGTTVTGNFFDVLGVRPALGRGFRYDETWDGSDDVVVLSHGLWVRLFGADPAVIGTTVPFGSAATPYEIIGVMPEGFSYPTDRTELWYPYGWDPAIQTSVSQRRAHYVRPVARLTDGVGLAEADAQFQAVVSALQEEYPETNRIMGAGMTPVRDFLIREVRSPLMVLLGAVTILLLLACANVANLMLVRANDRTREVALRSALGAGRARVARQLMSESLGIGVLGGAVGLIIGWLGVQGMARMQRLGIAGTTDLALDARVVAFTLGVAILSGVIFGTVPALRSASGDIQKALRDGGRGGTTGAGGLRAVGFLVTAEVALALLLVVGAGLMIRSGLLLRSVDPGFRVDGALAVELAVPSARYENRDQVLAFWDQLEESLEGRPGIERAGMVGPCVDAGAATGPCSRRLGHRHRSRGVTRGDTCPHHLPLRHRAQRPGDTGVRGGSSRRRGHSRLLCPRSPGDGRGSGDFAEGRVSLSSPHGRPDLRGEEQRRRAEGRALLQGAARQGPFRGLQTA